MKKVNKVVLAYSGGLDTSVILRWLKENYQCEVVTFTADLGQEEDFNAVEAKAKQQGTSEIFIENLKEEFVKDYVFPMFRANPLYEGYYLLGTAIARPLIAKKQIEIAQQVKADAVSHGATGKGNDQIRFELGYYYHQSDIEIISPWRIWDMNSRAALVKYADQHGIEISKDKRGEQPFSIDANVLHSSAEGKVLEDPFVEAPEYVYTRSVSPLDAPNEPEEITIDFKSGDACAINGENLSPYNLLEKLNVLGGKHGVGRIDLVENRFIGMKSRGVYETPGGTILYHAHRAIESITLDKEAAHTKDEIAPKYAKLIYNGLWFSPERDMLQAMIDQTQINVSGRVRMKLYKGNVMITGRDSPFTLYNADLATFEDDQIYSQQDAEGFIKLNALRLRDLAKKS
ncbi:argininosuccinate synthase [Pelagibacterales bacterium]|jgi:argininosuccinate synthase|nr:argininosuccinate synthase [Pelagibacterales bacterium]MDB4220235.1 argininosuccinate synthase [Pelagibacterales bacterium]MDB9818131.1 argininosuccinate synthase [Pelagibacterales bacterium]|tara:strand:+ start:141 stop:1343 length:1203 start_codon:yes stop_codon:yes gene_type:complete